MYTNPKISASLILVSLVYHIVLPQYGLADLNLIEEQEFKLPLMPFNGLVTLQGQALIQLIQIPQWSWLNTGCQ